ncbi:MAG: hypothetical protein M1828_002244 [Chrysothrix sp. TS-e1954]|nr:MAG: hypothetical protein M1828_002244 [Chrysothrix sp. TS-e1954]
MAIQQQLVHSDGIYHGLPVFPKEVKGLTALITGANGISGYHMLRVLAKDPERWSKIYCLSRRPPAVPEGLPKNAEHIACDFLKSPEEIGKVLKENNIKADHVFFFAYIQPPPLEGQGIWSDTQELTRVNSALLNNFLGGMQFANVQPKRFMLQTGAKNYAIHNGPIKQPQEEGDPRVQLEPNFYYPQEDALIEYCQKISPNTAWNVAMPSFIPGAVPDAAMNITYPLAVYAAVKAHLGETLDYPGDINSWQMPLTMSCATMNAYIEEWMVLTEGAQNQRFNACDGGSFTWESFWPRLAAWYGIESKGPDPKANYTEMPTPYDPPPRGYGGPATMRFNFMTAQWAQQPKVAKAWEEIATKHGLRDTQLRDVERVFGFLDGALLMAFPVYYSTDKARKMGWHGFVDSNESYLEVFRDLAKLKMIPPVPEKSVEFN